MLYGGVQHNPPSRFLSEIGDKTEMALDSSGGYFAPPSPAAFTPSPASNEPRYVPDLSEGDGVKHQLFGLGTIVEMDGDNATIYFKGKGTKKLNIAFAPLEKL